MSGMKGHCSLKLQEYNIGNITGCALGAWEDGFDSAAYAGRRH